MFNLISFLLFLSDFFVLKIVLKTIYQKLLINSFDSTNNNSKHKQRGEQMLVGYARVSTDKQVCDRQLDELISAGVSPEYIYQESISGKKRERTELNNMIKALRKGDIVVVTELTRISRSTKDLLALVDKIEKKGASIKSLKEDWLDTSTAHGQLIFTIMAGLAQFEADLTRERVRSGLASARARGRIGGRPKVNQNAINKAIILYDSQNFSLKQIEEMTGVSKATIYRYLKNRK